MFVQKEVDPSESFVILGWPLISGAGSGRFGFIAEDDSLLGQNGSKNGLKQPIWHSPIR